MAAKLPLVERLLRKVVRLPESKGGHWLFTGKLNNNGYGVIRDGERTVLVHRVMLAHATGDDGVGLDAAHDDSKGCPRHCCHPDHLDWKCHWENMRDVARKNGGLFVPRLHSARRPIALPFEAEQ